MPLLLALTVLSAPKLEWSNHYESMKARGLQMPNCGAGIRNSTGVGPLIGPSRCALVRCACGEALEWTKAAATAHTTGKPASTRKRRTASAEVITVEMNSA